MSDAKKCDRCGGFYTLHIENEEDNIAGISLLDKYDRVQQSLDLCQECRKKLMRWLEKKGEKND